MAKKGTMRSSLDGCLKKNNTINIRGLKVKPADKADWGSHGILHILLLFF